MTAGYYFHFEHWQFICWRYLICLYAPMPEESAAEIDYSFDEFKEVIGSKNSKLFMAI